MRVCVYRDCAEQNAPAYACKGKTACKKADVREVVRQGRTGA